MLCSREVLPPGLRSRWPASEKLPSAMAGAQPGRCMGRAGGRRARPALSAAPSALETEKRLRDDASLVRPSNPMATDPRSSSAGDAGGAALAGGGGERSARGRLGHCRSRRCDSRELGLRGLKAASPLTPAPPLWLPTQSPPPPPRSGRIPQAGAAPLVFLFPQTLQTHPGASGGVRQAWGPGSGGRRPPPCHSGPDALGLTSWSWASLLLGLTSPFISPFTSLTP